MNKVILDLCSGSGNWSRPYVEAGYTVEAIDLPTDVRLIPKRPGEVYGILAAPPCTVFSASGAWVKRTPDELKLALSVVDACLRAVAIYKPHFWALENPSGSLSRWLGKPAFTFNPCEYGDPWTKRTCLWGSFVIPTKTPVKPTGSIIDQNGCRSCCNKATRAKTPPGFARAFFEANR